ncbi:hypothetical protein COC69_20960 [Bacillus cereus]|uniref:Group-specific protein n=1 Tax=Bacillus cereus TaxID=1396 RepID=A0A9X7CKM2_BACCE|nr:hypothetical protein [Bacillus cereus]PGS76894.1 hypothetical protein COC69_20960 [Bacillus cereus]
MKKFHSKSLIKKCTGIALAAGIGLGALGAFDTSVHAAEKTNYVMTNEIMQAEKMSMKQLQGAIQQKNDPFINQVKVFINKYFSESEFLWGKISDQLKIDIVDLLVGNKKDYSKKVDAGLKNHFKEVPAILKLATPGFKKDLIKLLDYLPNN